MSSEITQPICSSLARGALATALNQPVKALWSMQNGYALCTRVGLDAIAGYLGALQPEELDMRHVDLVDPSSTDLREREPL